MLSENADFAEAVENAGLCWVGPSAEAITAMGDKVRARNLVAAAGVPVSGGAGDVLLSADEAVEAADLLGYPVMLKATGGGGGIGMTVLRDPDALRKAYAGTVSMAERSFGSDRVFVEKFIESARHIEVQILGTADGTVVVLGERDCSVQRRHQKIAEECPAPGLTPEVREALHSAAIATAASVGYRNAGTVEFLMDTVTGDFVFLEMNTRIQVEHPVTELVYGVDLVEQQLSIAWTGTTTPGFAPSADGHAIELRLCAEDPVRFFPSPGPIDEWSMPSGDGVRVDAGYRAGLEVSRFFDPLIAKICVHAPDRDAAVDAACRALAEVQVGPVKTNLPFLQQLIEDPEFRSGGFDTAIIGRVQSSTPVSS